MGDRIYQKAGNVQALKKDEGHQIWPLWLCSESASWQGHNLVQIFQFYHSSAGDHHEHKLWVTLADLSFPFLPLRFS